MWKCCTNPERVDYGTAKLLTKLFGFECFGRAPFGFASLNPRLFNNSRKLFEGDWREWADLRVRPESSQGERVSLVD